MRFCHSAPTHAVVLAVLSMSHPDKDIVRTDAESLLFSGPNNPRVIMLHNSLMAYAIHRPAIGTTLVPWWTNTTVS